MANVNTEDLYYGTEYERATLAPVATKRSEQVGLFFPVGDEPGKKGGYFKRSTGIALVKQHVRQLLLTEKGERVMLPNYGVGLRKYLFSPMDEYLFNEIRRDIITAISQYARNVKIRKLSVFQNSETTPQGGNGLAIKLFLQYRNTDTLFDVTVEIV